MARKGVISTILNLKDRFSAALRRAGRNSQRFSRQLNEAQAAAKKMRESLSRMAKVAGAVSFAAVGVSIGAAATSFKDYDTAVRQAAARTGATEKELSSLRKTIESVYADNFGESWEDVADSVAATKQLFAGTGESIKKMTEDALTLKSTFGYEVGESARAATMMMNQFGISGEEAYNLIAQASQKGLNKNGDLMDVINEYSVHFKQLGLNAEDMFNILKGGADNGAFTVDKVGDAFKELGIRVKDGSNTTIEAFQGLGLNAEKMASAFAAGGPSAREAFQTVQKSLANVSDPVKRNAIAVNLFGTMWEDLGEEATLAAFRIDGGIDTSKNAIAQINKIKFTSFSQAMHGIGRQAVVACMPIGKALLPMLNKFAKWLGEKVPKAAESFSLKLQSGIASAAAPARASLHALTAVIKMLKKHMGLIIPVIAGVVSGMAGFQIIVGVAGLFRKIIKVTKEYNTISKILNATMLKNPFVIAAIAIGALVTGFILAYKHSETFRNAVNKIAGNIAATVAPAIKAIGGWFKEHVLPVLSAAKEAFLLLWNKVLAPLGNFLAGVLAPIFYSVFENMWIQVSVAFETIKGVIEAVLKVFRGILTFISGVFTGNWSKAWNGIKTIFSGIWDGIKALAKAPLLWIEKKIEALKRKVSSFAESVKDIPILGSVANWASKKIGGKALGTPYFSGGLTHINERGGEIINLPGGTQIIPHDVSKKAVGGNNVTVSVTVQGNVIGNQEFMEQMGNYLVKRIQAAAAVC